MKKCLILTALIWNLTTSVEAQFNPNHTIDTVFALSEVKAPIKSGMEVLLISSGDTSVNIFNGGRWVKIMDSAHVASAASASKPYVNTATTTSGIATFYITNDKTATGLALYANIDNVTSAINDAANSYTYAWAVVGKTLTVTAKVSSQNTVALVGLTLLGVPGLVTNGTSVSVTVNGH